MSLLPPLEIILLEEVPIFEQLRLEEALLRTEQKNFCILNHRSSPAIVLGISNKVEEMIDLEAWQKKPIPLIRRFSGGGTVVIDEDTYFVTFIIQEADTLRSTPQKIHAWLHNFYRRAFNLPTFSLLENDYVLGLKKFGGNAQSIIKGRWLHHTSFLWDYRSEFMRYLKIPPKTPEYRLLREHDHFLCKLKEAIASKETLQQQLIAELKRQFNCAYASYEELKSCLEKPHRQSTVRLDEMSDEISDEKRKTAKRVLAWPKST